MNICMTHLHLFSWHVQFSQETIIVNGRVVPLTRLERRIVVVFLHLVQSQGGALIPRQGGTDEAMILAYASTRWVQQRASLANYRQLRRYAAAVDEKLRPFGLALLSVGRAHHLTQGFVLTIMEPVPPRHNQADRSSEHHQVETGVI